MGAAVGIDLGTTNTVVAVVRDGRAVTLADEAGRKLLPSVVSFHPSGDVRVGEAARERRLIDPANTIYSVKRLIGRSWQSEEVQQARGRFPFDLREGLKSSTTVAARGERYSLSEISAFVLRRAKAIAEMELGEPVDRAVITVPANFNDLQRAATKVAGKLAGFEVLRILNEPTAAALAYGQGSTGAERLAVYDLGGGTFDVTLLDLSGNVFEVLSTAGDSALGGDDIDLAIADMMADQIVREQRFDPRVDAVELGRLRIHAERVKQLLSTEQETSVFIDDVGLGASGEPPVVQFRLTRDELERETGPMLARTLDVCQSALIAATLEKEQIDRIILVGGPTRMPIVAREVQAFFGKAPSMKVNPDEVVALGAAIQAHVLDRARLRQGRARAAPFPSMPPESVPQPVPASAASASERRAPPVPAGAGRHPPPIPPGPPSPRGPAIIPQPVLSVGRRAPSVPPEAPISLPRGVPSLTFDPPLQGPESRDPASLPRSVPSLTFGPPAPPVTRGAPPSSDGLPTSLGGAPRGPAAPDLPRAPASLPSERPNPSSAPPPARPVVQPFAQFIPTKVQAAMQMPASPASPPSAEAPAPALAPAPAPPPAPPQARPAPQPALVAPLLIDVTPLSLRVETVGGFSDMLIAANTAVPCDRTRVFLTASDNQTLVKVRVAQGEEPRFDTNTFLGELELSGIAPAARGDAKIGVTFEIDADGILNVRAKDIGTGREATARLQLLGAQVDPADVAAMARRQAAHAVTG